MAITYGDLKKRILLKIDEYEADADAMTSDEDIITRMPDVVNEAVRFVFYGKSHNKTWNVKQGTPINALEKKRNDPDYKPLYGEHRTEDIVYEADSACCYFFEWCFVLFGRILIHDARQQLRARRYPEQAAQHRDRDAARPGLLGLAARSFIIFAAPISSFPPSQGASA